MLKRLLGLVGLACLLCFVVSPALAHPGLTVGHLGGKGLKPEVAPGESYTQTLTARIGEGDAATDVLIEVLGYGEGVKPLLPEEDISPFSARTFIKPGRITLHVEPGETKQADVTVSIPHDVGDGGRYAILRFSTAPTGEGRVGVISAIVLPVKFTIKDSNLTHTGEITDITSGEAVSGQPVDIFTTLKNTGNHHFKVKGEVTISDASGETLDTIYISLSPVVIPTMSRQLKATFIPKGELPLGVYSIKSRVMLEDGTLLDEAEGSFEVKEPYVAPPPPAKLTVTPGSPAMLATGDGRISVSFPQGAVISQVEISLQNYPLEQLPGPPSDCQLATTCFRVDGLTGLLAKEATVMVKYTPADLKLAEGDASRLRLARWDEANNQWSVLKTKIDKKAMTLSTSTNQLSLWAVMVAPPTAVNWPLIGGVVAGVIIVALLIFFLAIKRRSY